MKYDCVIIGAGIVGIAAGYKILKQNPKCKIVILEKELKIASHQTGNNSGVIHSGIYYRPGSRKAENCISGYRQLVDFCTLHSIPFELCGKVIIATEEYELKGLAELRLKANKHGLTGVKELTTEALREKEPSATGLRALYVPQAGIVDYKQVARVLANQYSRLGGELALGCKVIKINKMANNLEVTTNRGTFRANKVINCSGLFSDRVGAMTSSQSELRILPFRGEYYNLRSSSEHLVKSLIYPVPNVNFPFLGVHFTRMIGGGVEMGPNAVLAFKREGYNKTDFSIKDTWATLSWPGFYRLAARHWKEGLQEYSRSFSKKIFLNSLKRLVPALEEGDLEVGNTGVRAQACRLSGFLEDDFAINRQGNVIHILNAPSPAATSCLSIADVIEELYRRD